MGDSSGEPSALRGGEAKPVLAHDEDSAADRRSGKWRLVPASDLSAFVTGTTPHVDGGTMASSGMIDWPFGGGGLPGPETLRRFASPRI